MKLESELKSQSQLLKQPDDKRYFNREETLKLLETVPIPEEAVIPPRDKSYVIGLEERIIDENPADDGGSKNKDEWIEYFNRRNEIMISMPDIYLAGKSINQKLVVGEIINFKEVYEISSTSILYEPTSLMGNIIHYLGSTVTKLIESERIYIPYYIDASLNSVLDTPAGLLFLQTLFGTKDNADMITKTLENLGCPPILNIGICTPRAQDRNFPKRTCGFGYHLGGAHVDGSLILGSGRSRAVRITNPNNKGAK